MPETPATLAATSVVSPVVAGSSMISIGELPAPVNPVTHLKSRILEIVASGSQLPWSRVPGPGCVPWWEARQRVGGKFAQADFVAAVGELLAEGRLIEGWLQVRGRTTTSHVLLMPGRSEAMIYPIRQAKGLPN